MRTLQVSAISFLNTAPLLWDFEHGQRPPWLSFSYDLPSACAEHLRAGTADIGIMPVAAYADISDLVVLPDVAIAARGPVRSILLVSKKPLEEISSVAADSSSRSSVAMCQVLFRRFIGSRPTFVTMAPEQAAMLAACDAALIIGDPALRLTPAAPFVYDLASEWLARTGKPFVFAFWAVRKAVLEQFGDPALLTEAFIRSRDRGLEHLDEIARDWSSRLQMPAGELHSYLRDNVHYFLDEECRQGMELFFRLAAETSVLPQSPPVTYLGAATASEKP